MRPGDRVIVVCQRTDAPGKFPEVGTFGVVVALDKTTSSWPDLQLVKIKMYGPDDAVTICWLRPGDLELR